MAFFWLALALVQSCPPAEACADTLRPTAVASREESSEESPEESEEPIANAARDAQPLPAPSPSPAVLVLSAERQAKPNLLVDIGVAAGG